MSSSNKSTSAPTLIPRLNPVPQHPHHFTNLTPTGRCISPAFRFAYPAPAAPAPFCIDTSYGTLPAYGSEPRRHVTSLNPSHTVPHTISHGSSRRIAVCIATANAPSRRARARKSWRTFRSSAAALADPPSHQVHAHSAMLIFTGLFGVTALRTSGSVAVPEEQISEEIGRLAARGADHCNNCNIGVSR
jgi:hypothetical protein